MELEHINNLVKEEKCVVFGFMRCPACVEAMKVLHANGGEKCKVVKIDNLPSAYTRALVAKTGRDTVPNIFINGENIGGYTELLNVQSLREKLTSPS
eukprot:gnl/Spiro4/11709_TR6179_c0_g1_i1.p1 gnl/Spiro4/11709_TR6179_c0_g1~~gnl/Spiro4/11709_TR6179_c0_g1_i1.p1  ORF type:complete len:106 (-),score=16.27 gnl/Spiro4/11709_TR6179_c0_g1_i1:35-325(-)